MAQLGKPYVLGGSGPDCFDCSGLVYYGLRQVGVHIGRYSAAGYSQVSSWPKISDYHDLKRGDLIFYWDDNHYYIGHVAVYLGNGQFIHASSSHGQMEISNFGSWSINHWAWGRRVFY